MQKDREFEGLNARENWLEHRIVKIVPGNVGTEIDSAHAWQFAGPLEFAEGTVRMEHGQSQKGDQPARVGLMCCRRRVIPSFCEFRGKFRITPIQHGSSEDRKSTRLNSSHT